MFFIFNLNLEERKENKKNNFITYERRKWNEVSGKIKNTLYLLFSLYFLYRCFHFNTKQLVFPQVLKHPKPLSGTTILSKSSPGTVILFDCWLAGRFTCECG